MIASLAPMINHSLNMMVELVSYQLRKRLTLVFNSDPLAALPSTVHHSALIDGSTQQLGHPL